MTQLTVTIPDSIYHNVQTVADKDGLLIDNFIALALGEKMAALMTEDYLSQRAKRGQRDKFLAVLNAVSDIEPSEEDKI